MDKIKIINANFFNNNYLNSKLFTPLNKICVENQKNITSKYNSFFDSHRVYDYTNPLVIECKNDLKNSKNLSEYKAVDTGIGVEKVTHVSALNSLVYCQNTSDGYGAITFGSNGPSGVIAFTDTKSDEPSGKTLSISFMKDLLICDDTPFCTLIFSL